MEEVLTFVRELLGEAAGKTTAYGQGFIDALGQVEEYIVDEMWERGEDVSA